MRFESTYDAAPPPTSTQSPPALSAPTPCPSSIRNSKVHGIEDLRNADGSVMPSIVSVNTNAAVLAIAERAASLLTGELVVPTGIGADSASGATAAQPETTSVHTI